MQPVTADYSLTGTDPALRDLERRYRMSGGDLERQAWVTALLVRDLVEGSEVQFLPSCEGMHMCRRHGADAWFYVQEYTKFQAELVAPGVWRPVHASNLTLVPLHKTRLALLKATYTLGCSPEFFVHYLRDWRPARVVMREGK